ncbi:MAG: D-glycero-alpha-D-manno-heptose-1,7-bisphosphate 7-phosphatase [bacterium]
MHKAVFLDRDGTIIEDPGYLSRPEQVRFLPGAIKGLKKMQEAGYLLVIITNQSGIARGYFTEDDLKKVHDYLTEQLARQGIDLAGIYYCPHHPEKGYPPYVKKCRCRKPGSALLERAAEELKINLAASWMIGDKASDILAGKRAGCRTVLIAGQAAADCQPDWLASDLEAAYLKIKGDFS